MFKFSLFYLVLDIGYILKGTKLFIFALSICFIYACTDEYHQTFVSGRTGQFTDSLIDTFGGTLGCLFYNSILKINYFKEKHI